MNDKQPSRLRKILCLRGIAQRELARQSGLSEHVISRIVHERLNPTESEKFAISCALKVSPAKLFGESPASLDDFFNTKKTHHALPKRLRRALAAHCAENAGDGCVCGLVFDDPDDQLKKFLVLSIDQATILADLASGVDWQRCLVSKFLE